MPTRLYDSVRLLKTTSSGQETISALTTQTQKMRDFRNSLWLIARGSIQFEASGSHRVARNCTKHKEVVCCLGSGCLCL